MRWIAMALLLVACGPTQGALHRVQQPATLAPLSPELPGAWRARLQVLDAQNPEAALTARMALTDHLSPAWFAANHDLPPALRAAVALLDASHVAAADTLDPRGRRDEAAAHRAAWRARRIAPPPVPITPMADADNPADFAHHLMRSGHFDTAATVWLSLAVAQPQNAVVARLSATVALMKAGRLLEARQTATRVLDGAPARAEALMAARVRATTSEQLFDFEAAIAACIDLARRARATPEATDALMRAAFANLALGRPVTAALLLERVVKIAPHESRRLLKAAALYAKANEPERQRAVLETLLALDAGGITALEARAMLARSLTGRPRAMAFRALAQSIDALGSDDDRPRHLLAEALFEAMEPAFRAFETPPPWPKDARLHRAHLAQRLRAMRTLGDQSGAILDLHVLEWALAAIYRLGRAYTAFVAHVDQAPPPTGLSPEERTQFRALMHAASQPVGLKALHAYAVVAERGATMPNNVWVTRARAALCALNRCPPAPTPIRFGSVPTARSMPLFARLERATHPAAQAILAAGIAAVDDGRRADAELIFARGAALHPDFVEAELNVALLQQWRGESGRLAVDRARQMGRLPNAVSMVDAMGRWRAGTSMPAARLTEDARIWRAQHAQTPAAAADIEAKARFEAFATHRFARLNRLRSALQTRPAFARFMADSAWVRSDALALDLLAESLMTTGHSDRARQLLTEATRLPGGAHAEAFARLAVIEAKAGRLNEARRLNREALSRQPDLAAARTNLDQITIRTPVAR